MVLGQIASTAPGPTSASATTALSGRITDVLVSYYMSYSVCVYTASETTATIIKSCLALGYNYKLLNFNAFKYYQIQKKNTRKMKTF